MSQTKNERSNGRIRGLNLSEGLCRFYFTEMKISRSISSELKNSAPKCGIESYQTRNYVFSEVSQPILSKLNDVVVALGTIGMFSIIIRNTMRN